jgi:hypothetical protein
MQGAISEYEVSQKKFTGPRKGQFLEIDERRKTGINYTVLMAHTMALSIF